LQGKLLSFHFKDTDKIGHGAVDVVLGSGAADVRGMLTELKRQRFSGLIALEYEPASKGEELVEELRRSIAYIDGVARELTAEAAPAR
jgi:sugar phosphate isomerase/epimerase